MPHSPLNFVLKIIAHYPNMNLHKVNVLYRNFPIQKQNALPQTNLSIAAIKLKIKLTNTHFRPETGLHIPFTEVLCVYL